ncbi:glycerophosphodiester phosphodiesterase family protein [Microbacterium sp. P02]|uniref:glycerophosphodiester phosphodiesterase family protein n=1 Tax=unclassified Microbacterium TaxID=2609290 RepID=UPI00366E667E
MHPWFERTELPRVLAHRGLVTADAADHGVTENSFAAVAQAHAAGAIYVESDCHRTSDGRIVLFHDDDLLRITGDPRRVSQVTERELEHLMADRGGLISLPQALESFPTLRFNLDVKAPDAAADVGRLVAKDGARVLLTSFSDARRRAACEAAESEIERRGEGIRPATSAGVKTLAKVVSAVALRSAVLVRHAVAGIDALQIPERRGRLAVLSPRLIEYAHRAGVEVHVWTVNDPAEMRRLLHLGVDGLVTDRADLALSVVAENRR